MREFSKKLLSTALSTALILCAAPSWEIAHAASQALGMGGAKTGAWTPVPAIAPEWKLCPSYDLLRSFPALAALSLPQEPLLALARSLDRAGIAPKSVAQLEPDAQLQEVRRALKTLSAALRREQPPADPSLRVQSAARALAALRDLRLSVLVLAPEDRREFIHALKKAEGSAQRRLRKESDALVRSALEAFSAGAQVEWSGRTAHILLEDGSVVAFKRHADIASRTREKEKMAQAFSFGIDAPIPLLTQPNETFSLKEPDRNCGPKLYLPYLLPAALAKDYRAYLNDKLPKGLGEREKARRIQAGALKAVDHMLILLRNGYAHSSLTPLSHHGDHWEWDFWRWNTPFLGGLRYGPSFINNWKKGLSYPNIRFSGLADWEHIERWDWFYQEHAHMDHSSGKVLHDAYSLAMGQNLAELSLVLLHSGSVNGLSPERTAGILLKAQMRFLAGLLPKDARAALDKAAMFKALRSTSRRFDLLRRFWKPAVWLLGATSIAWLLRMVSMQLAAFGFDPLTQFFYLAAAVWFGAHLPLGEKYLPLFIGAAVSLDYLYGFPPLLILFQMVSTCVYFSNIDGLDLVPSNLPGWTLQPLIMRALKPCVDLLREKAAVVGFGRWSNPSGSRWDFRPLLVFLFGLAAAFIIPASLLGAFAFFCAQLATLAGLAVPAWVIPAAFALGASLFPARSVSHKLRRAV